MTIAFCMEFLNSVLQAQWSSKLCFCLILNEVTLDRIII